MQILPQCWWYSWARMICCLPLVLQGVAAFLAPSTVAPSTLRSYKKAWADFLLFNGQTVEEVTAPHSSSQVLKYLAHLFQMRRAARTLRLHSAAISFFSRAFFNKDPCGKFVVRRAVEGWGRLTPSKPIPRRPITLELLAQMHTKLRSICWSKFEARLFSAAFSLAFFGALRVGEVVLEPKRDGGSRGLLLQDVSMSPSDLQINIRNSKTDQLGRGAVIRLPASGEGGPCPVKDLKRYLALRPVGEGPLFIHEDGHPLVRHQFTKVMRKAIVACGLEASEFAPHSFRIGAATTAAHWGLSVKRIKDLGRWRSDAFKTYVRK